MNKAHLLAVVLLCNTISTNNAVAEEHEHHHEQMDQSLSLNQGGKWPIDESLHIGMERLKHSVVKSLDDIHQNRFTSEQYAKLVPELERHLVYIFENCKLPPDADKQLHILLGKAFQGINLIKESTSKKSGVIQIIQVLQDYPVYFQDTNWRGMKH